MRTAFRQLFTIYPKIRTVVEPTLFSYRYRILADNDRQIEVFFQEAFRIVPGLVYGTDEFDAYKRDLMHESFSLGAALPVKIRYIDNDSRPVILLSLHHMIGDGTSVFHMITSLLRTLQGELIPPVPLDRISIISAQLRKPFIRIPGQIGDAIRDFSTGLKQAKDYQVIPLVERPAPFFGTSGIHEHTLSHSLADVRAQCRTLGCTITVFLLSALADALRRQFYRDKGNTVGISLSIDIRPFLGDTPPRIGNYSGSIMIFCHARYWDLPAQRLNDIQQQLERHYRALRDGSRIWNTFLTSVPNLFGRKIYARSARMLKRRGLLTLPCALSNLGNLDWLNAVNPQAQLVEFMPIISHPGLFFFTGSLNDRMQFYISYPEYEFAPADIVSLMRFFEEGLDAILHIRGI